MILKYDSSSQIKTTKIGRQVQGKQGPRQSGPGKLGNFFPTRYFLLNPSCKLSFSTIVLLVFTFPSPSRSQNLTFSLLPLPHICLLSVLSTPIALSAPKMRNNNFQQINSHKLSYVIIYSKAMLRLHLNIAVGEMVPVSFPCYFSSISFKIGAAKSFAVL